MTRHRRTHRDAHFRAWIFRSVRAGRAWTSSAPAADEPDLIFPAIDGVQAAQSQRQARHLWARRPRGRWCGLPFSPCRKRWLQGLAWPGGRGFRISRWPAAKIGPIHFKGKLEQGDDMFRRRRSLFFKKMQIVRGCDAKRNVLVYMVYSDRIIEGSPKNSTSSVPIMPWGAADFCRSECGDFIE